MARVARTVNQRIRRLRTFNRVAASLHLVLAVGLSYLLVLLGESISLEGARDLLFGGRDVSVSAGQSTLFVGIALVLMLLISTVCHFLVASPTAFRYTIGIKTGYSTIRWVDFALSSSILLWVLAEITAIAHTSAFVVLIIANVALLVFGSRLERADAPGRALYPGFLIGALVAALPWLALLFYVMGPGSTGETRPAVFVFTLVLSVFVSAGAFVLNQVLPHFRVGPWRDFVFGEGVYIALNLGAKLALTAQIVAAAVLPRLDL
ncbi:hypothetical protein E3T55_06175 [Cryobacterium frigoriphilum]|uniref:Uncharacterized protein n=1 Tax=Cryobacterium frigoriphilum TaxID=1259150 RepID=A0A4R9A6G7_9MICO|nr:heliorhodopsin HeR [Cryobacterium frigoriphilum]TFD52749.1 hypothetical protein E3T55_06175 [Cryobacterium frigoriphilum]